MRFVGLARSRLTEDAFSSIVRAVRSCKLITGVCRAVSRLVCKAAHFGRQQYLYF
jgi:hypothetical protein